MVKLEILIFIFLIVILIKITMAISITTMITRGTELQKLLCSHRHSMSMATVLEFPRDMRICKIS